MKNFCNDAYFQSAHCIERKNDLKWNYCAVLVRVGRGLVQFSHLVCVFSHLLRDQGSARWWVGGGLLATSAAAILSKNIRIDIYGQPIGGRLRRSADGRWILGGGRCGYRRHAPYHGGIPAFTTSKQSPRKTRSQASSFWENVFQTETKYNCFFQLYQIIKHHCLHLMKRENLLKRIKTKG